MEGVRSGLESSLARIEKVRTADDLAWKMEGWAEETDGPEIDAPDYPELMRQAGTLDERNGAPAKDQETIREWEDAGAGWKEARAEVEKFVELVGRIDGQRKEHEAGCVEAGRLLPAPSLLRSGAKRVYRMAERLESRMDAGERNAHIRAAGRDPDSLDSAVREIHDWLAVQERKQRKSLPWTTTEFRCRQGEFQSIHGLSRSGSGQSRSIRIHVIPSDRLRLVPDRNRRGGSLCPPAETHNPPLISSFPPNPRHSRGSGNPHYNHQPHS